MCIMHTASNDVSKEFDRMNIYIDIYIQLDKLRKACVNEAVMRIIGSMLSNTFLSV